MRYGEASLGSHLVLTLKTTESRQTLVAFISVKEFIMKFFVCECGNKWVQQELGSRNEITITLSENEWIQLITGKGEFNRKQDRKSFADSRIEVKARMNGFF